MVMLMMPNRAPHPDARGAAHFGIGNDLHELELVRTVAAPKVTHIKFARR